MINLPKECIVDKFIPKKTFYEKVNISSALKQEFVDKLEKITWKYKLSESNTNILKTENIEEIEIFEIVLKEKNNLKGIIKIITKEIPYPILFLIYHNSEFQYAIKYDEEIYFSEWNKEINFNFNDYNFEKVYENIVKKITNLNNNISNIQEKIEKLKEIEKIQKEIYKLENQIRIEKQFNKKVELNKKVIELKNKFKK